MRFMTTICSLVMMVQIFATEELHLPDLMTTSSGNTVVSEQQWQQQRRPELLELFTQHVYGRMPSAKIDVTYAVFEQDDAAFLGKAIRKQVAVTATNGTRSQRIELLVYLPISAKQHPVPVFLMLNFLGNHAINPDPAIVISPSWMPEKYQPKESMRGREGKGIPFDVMLERGFGFATAYCGDIDPDYDHHFEKGIHALIDTPNERTDDTWGAVGAWAWGLSRFMDYFEKDEHIDQGRIAVLGHSRLGKAALWAGAQDQRFSVVISNNSGCTGAAVTRNRKGETVKAINKRFPYWFCRKYHTYSDNEGQLPIDQHMLLALVAPRPVYVASAEKDKWADPEGEFLSCVKAAPAYQLFGHQGLGTETLPDLNTPLTAGHIGYHLRTGGHAMTAYDWQQFIDFADRHWRQTDR